MPRRSAEDEVAYAFAPPSTRAQEHHQQRHSPAFSSRGEPLNAAPLSAFSAGSSSATTSESDEGDSSDAACVVPYTAKKTRARRAAGNTAWQESEGDEAFRHFRKKRVVTATSLQMDVNDLKAEVANLRLLRDILASRVMVRRDDTVGSLMRTARAYYEHFRDGYNPQQQSFSLPAKRKRSFTAAHQQQVDQAAFLQSILSPTMEAGPLEAGLPLMLEQWRRYSAFFALHAFKMTSADVVTTDQVAIVRTKGEFALQVTAATIAGIFPHLLLGQHQQRLVDRILGRVLTCPCFVDLYFDAQGQVIRYDEAGDFLGAFSSLLTSPRDLVELFDGALLWEAGVIGSLEPIGIDDKSGAFLAGSPVAVVDKGRPAARVRKLYEIDFLLNHEFLDGDEAVSKPSELNLYEYDDDERTVYTQQQPACGNKTAIQM